MKHRSQVFGERLRAFCETQPSQAHVARELGISRQQLSRYVHGTTVPRDGLLSAMAQFFEVPVEAFFTEAVENNDSSQDHVRLLEALVKTPFLQSIDEVDLSPGFYLLYTTSTSGVLVSLTQFFRSRGSWRFKIRTSAKLARDLPGIPVDNVFEGAVFKSNNMLYAVNASSKTGLSAFFILERSSLYSSDLKPGLRLFSTPGGNRAPICRSVVFRKLPHGISALAAARMQGVFKLEDVPVDVRVELEAREPKG